MIETPLTDLEKELQTKVWPELITGCCANWWKHGFGFADANFPKFKFGKGKQPFFFADAVTRFYTEVVSSLALFSPTKDEYLKLIRERHAKTLKAIEKQYEANWEARQADKKKSKIIQLHKKGLTDV